MLSKLEGVFLLVSLVVSSIIGSCLFEVLNVLSGVWICIAGVQSEVKCETVDRKAGIALKFIQWLKVGNQQSFGLLKVGWGAVYYVPIKGRGVWMRRLHFILQHVSWALHSPFPRILDPRKPACFYVFYLCTSSVWDWTFTLLMLTATVIWLWERLICLVGVIYHGFSISSSSCCVLVWLVGDDFFYLGWE